MVYKTLAQIFLRLGLFAYGGPVAHNAMMRDIVVDQKKWFTDDEFLEMMSFTNLIPGPNSTEMALIIGHKKGGIKGALIAGISFISPAIIIVLAFTSIYIHFHTLPEMEMISKGLIPALLIIIGTAGFKLASKTVTTLSHQVFLAILVGLMIFGLSEIVVLLIGGVYFIIKSKVDSSKQLSIEPFSLLLLFLVFLKIGAILYGSGYALFSFLQTEFVDNLGWITSTQLIDMIAIGEITPGPLFTTATSIGYFLGGFSGSLLATLGIFLPSFLIVLFIYPVFEKHKNVSWVNAFLKGVNIASIAIVINVILNLSLETFSNLTSITLLMLLLLSQVFFKTKPIYLILMGGVLGYFIF